jgi:hypothetical protein
MSGWIKAHRQMRESPMLQSAVRKGVWLDLLLMAAHQPTRVSLRGRVVDLDPGQCAIVMGDWAKTLGLTPRQLERIMDSFVSENGVSRRAGPGKAYTLITITKYSQFQSLRESRGESPVEETGQARGKGGEREQEPEEPKEDIYSVADATPAKPLPRRERYPPASKLPMNGKGKRYPGEFEDVWASYPRQPQDTKPGCYERWRKAVVDDKAGPDAITMAAKSYASANGYNEYRFGLLRWLRERLWLEGEAPRAQRKSTDFVVGAL